jgi:hypothetical protein
MDMTRHLQRWLTLGELQKVEDRYEGVIADVVESALRNPFTKQRGVQPVILFEDGWRVVPNIAMRRALIEFFGTETRMWIGRRFVVFRHRVERLDPDTGRTTVKWEKRAMLPDVGSVVQLSGPRGRR